MSLVLYLYRKYTKEFEKNDVDICNFNDIYCFCNNKILGVDKNIYGRSKRLELQQEYDVEPYYVTQETLKNILLTLNNKTGFTITNIRFLDKSVCEFAEYRELTKCIMSGDTMKIYESVKNIMNENDTEIEKIVFNYLNNSISISAQGVLALQSKESLMISNLDKIILGI